MIKATCSVSKADFQGSLTMNIMNFMPFWSSDKDSEWLESMMSSNLLKNNRGNFTKLFGKYCFYETDSAGRRLYIWELHFEEATFFAITTTDSSDRGTSFEVLAHSPEDRNDPKMGEMVKSFLDEMAKMLDLGNRIRTFDHE